ncbi:RHS repeat-associated core domain-containing protein [Bacteroides faecis]|nr:RHS repeat-associated core domain-containing protein [Bacteroides faecis]
MPSLIKFENGSNISYLYSPEGAKLRTTHVTDKDTLITDYCGNVIYENGIPVKLLTEVGYVTLADAVHHYFLQDHQGNNRVVIDENNNVDEVNHYYPFGGVFASTSSVQPFKYNSKELDRKNGLDWYDYGARMYDAALGRWHVADPSSEKNYSNTPYGYCFNNPVTHIDPDGKQGVAIPTPYGPLPFYYPLTRTQSYNLPSDQQIMRHTSDKFAELGQMITDAPKMSYTFGSLLYYQVKSAVSPEYNHQRKRDRKAKENLDKNQANVANSIDTNVSGMMPNGDPAPKRDPNDKSKIGKAGKKVLIGSGIARTALELTTPDPTQDAYEAHTNQVVGKEEYSTNYIRDIFEWIIEQLKD